MTQRSTGLAGISCAIAVAVALFLPGPRLPSAVDSGQAVAAFINAHWFAWMLGAWLTFPEMAFFLWFTVGLRDHLHRCGESDFALTLFMIAGAIGTVAVGLIATTLQIVLGIVPIQELGSQAERALYVGWLVSGVPVLFMPLALVLFAAARSMSRIESIPGWLAWLGYAAAAVSAIGTITTFFATGLFALNGPVGYLAFFIFAVWIVFTSLHLIKGNLPRVVPRESGRKVQTAPG